MGAQVAQGETATRLGLTEALSVRTVRPSRKETTPMTAGLEAQA